jgi:stalled ribosome rescue protein Dom34
VSLFHAVVWIDHQTAQILQFDAEHVQAQRVKAHSHLTRRHASGVRTEHEFFGHVCDAVAEIPEILVTGSHTALADLRHYVEKHRPQVVPRIFGWEVVDHPSENQLVAMARKAFLKIDRMNGVPTPT